GQILDPAADARVLLGSGGLHALHLVRILHGHAAPLDHHTPELEITLARLHETADARVAADVAGLDALSLRIKVDGAVQKGEPQRVGDRSAIPLERGQDQRALRRQELAHFLGRHGGGHPVPPGQHIKSRRARGTFGNARKTTTSAAIRDFPLLRPTNYGVDLLVVRGNLTIKGSYVGSASSYGTFDQGGNTAQRTEGIVGSRSICNSAIQPHDYPHVPAPGAGAIESRDEEFA